MMNSRKHDPAAASRHWTRARLLTMILLAAFLLAFGSASLAIYRWARTTAALLPSLVDLSLPEIVLTDEGAVEATPVAVPTVPASPAEQTKAAETGAQATPVPTSKRVTVLLLGVDQRPDDPEPLLTDTMIVLTIDPATRRVGMISLPRDLFVPIADVDYSGKINTAFAIGQNIHYPGGGGALAKKTVSEFIGYPIDYYITMNFNGFIQAVDAIGGIDVIVSKTIHDVEYPTIDYGVETFHLNAGPQHLDGETALKFVRTRHGDSDLQRAQRQQQALLAIKEKLIEDKLLTPVRLLELFRVVSKSVTDDIPTTQLPGLLALASQVQLDKIDQLVIDERHGTVNPESKYGWILVPNRDKIRPAVDKVFNGRAVRTAAEIKALAEQQARLEAAQARQQASSDYQAQAASQRKQLQTEGARVALVNGTGDSNLTTLAADWLKRQGYVVVSAETADRSDYQRSELVTYRTKPVASAGLARMFAIPDDSVRAENVPPNSQVDLRLTIGRDFYLLVSN